MLRMRPLLVCFEGEEGLDQGGVTREWVDLLFSPAGVLNPLFGLFAASDTNGYSFAINAASNRANRDDAELFGFVGRVLAKCLCDGILVPLHFTPDIYCTLLGIEMRLRDLELLDVSVYSSIMWMLENDVTDLGFFFAIDVEDDSGEGVSSVELKPGGADIAVTNANKREFVELKARHIMVGQRQRQLDALRDGWASVMPLSDIEAFAPSELELLLCGVPTLDIEDWKANTVYKAGFSVSHRAISHFWAIVEAWNDDYRARLLRFVTGTAAVPPTGFAQLQGAEGLSRFSIMRVVWDDAERLPQAQTCFNQLLLPAYQDAGVMREKLELAILETEGFALK